MLIRKMPKGLVVMIKRIIKVAKWIVGSGLFSGLGIYLITNWKNIQPITKLLINHLYNLFSKLIFLVIKWWQLEIIILLLIWSIVLLQKSNNNKKNITPKSKIGLDWLLSLDPDELGKFLVLFWFPINNTLGSPKYNRITAWEDEISFQQTKLFDDLYKHRVLTYEQCDFGTYYRFRVNPAVYELFDNLIRGH